jgi:hypothetical protein
MRPDFVIYWIFTSRQKCSPVLAPRSARPVFWPASEGRPSYRLRDPLLLARFESKHRLRCLPTACSAASAPGCFELCQYFCCPENSARSNRSAPAHFNLKSAGLLSRSEGVPIFVRFPGPAGSRVLDFN